MLIHQCCYGAFLTTITPSGERREMSTQVSLLPPSGPASPPCSPRPPWVPMYLIWRDLSSICSVDFRIASIFSLLFRERAGLCRRYVRLDILPMLGRDPPAVGSRRLGGRPSYCLCCPEGDLAPGLGLARAASPVIAAPRTGVCFTRSGPTANPAIPPWWPQQHQRTLFRVCPGGSYRLRRIRG
jgi:hypothetical protein